MSDFPNFHKRSHRILYAAAMTAFLAFNLAGIYAIVWVISIIMEAQSAI